MLQDIVCMTGLNWFMKKDIILNRPGLPHRVRSTNTLELFTLGTVTGEGILKIEVLDGCARFGQIVIRKSEK